MATLLTSEAPPEWVEVATIAELSATRRLALRIREVDLLLVQTGSAVVALHNRCTHLGKPLDRGRVMGGQITCPAHGACFELHTGKAIAGPAVMPLRLFPVRVQDAARIEVDLSKLPAAVRGGWFAGLMSK